MANQDMSQFANMFIEVEGNPLLMNQSLTMTKKSGLKPVYTIPLGLAGVSRGASEVEVKCENAVPSDDFEFNPDKYMQEGAIVDIGGIMAGRQTTLKGFIMEATYSQSVNDASKLDITFLCRFGAWQ